MLRNENDWLLLESFLSEKTTPLDGELYDKAWSHFDALKYRGKMNSVDIVNVVGLIEAVYDLGRNSGENQMIPPTMKVM